MSGAVDILGVGVAEPAAEPQMMEGPPGLGMRGCPAYVWPGVVSDGLVPPGALRRLGRAQRMAMVAALLAVKDCPPPERRESVAVCVGTGLGALGETVGFLENMISQEEREPKPTFFINSVHNSLASQIAIRLQFKGENCTFSQQAISFELALWQGMAAIRSGRAAQALVCGADELNPYVIAVGQRYGWWKRDGAPLIPMSQGAARGTLPGEGAAAFLLAAPQADRPRFARVLAAQAAPLERRHLLRPDGVRELAFVERSLARAGASLGEVDYVLLGANGDGPFDAAYARVADVVSRAAGRNISQGVFKDRCGEYYTAAALGLAVAVGLVRDSKASKVLLYNIYRAGYHSVCLVSA